MNRTTRRALLAGSAGLALTIGLLGASWAQDKTRLIFLVDNPEATVAVAEAVAEAFNAANPDIEVEVETRPGGAEGDNVVKTRLATGDMSDVFLYNAGSLFQAINPTQNLVDLTDEPFMDNVIDSFKTVVSVNDRVYGVPFQTAMGGGVLYNRKIYEELGLSVPKTWDEFMANNAKIKEAGKVPVIQTFRDSWTAQLFVLGDYYNVQAAEPGFADSYTANEAKYATTPAALRSWEKQAEVTAAGYINEDAAAAGLDDGLRMVATGEGAHYPMLTFPIPTIAELYPENLNDVGFFAIPGDDAATYGLTTWMPPSVYIPTTTEHLEEAKRFLAFLASKEGCDAQTAAVGATGPYLIKDCTLPEDVPQAVADLLPFFQEGGQTAPALEYLSPVKGPLMPQITVEVGSGIRSGADAAAMYDEDVRKQAQQLGLAGW